MSAAAVTTPASPAAKNNTSLTHDSNSRSGTRRRQVAVVEKKSNAEMITEGVAVNVKDSGNIIKGESALDRLRDLSRVKKGVIASRMSPRVRRKYTTRPEKPRRQIILAILIKNTVLLLLLFCFIRAIWKGTDTLGTTTGISLDALDFESRISELEASFKKAAKITQLQIEVVDEKMKQVEQKGAIFENKLTKLTARTDDMDKFLRTIQDSNFLSKQEYEIFLKELEESKTPEVGGKGLNLDDIMFYAKEVVRKEIEKHAADGLGRVDFALASGGAKVVRHSDPYNSGKVGRWLLVAKGQNGVHGNAQKMLEPSFGEPGHCFPLQGNSGFVEIRLRSGIVPDAITLEHVAKSVAYYTSSAPKDCRVSGWFEGPGDKPSSVDEKIYLLSEFVYDLEKSNAQTFNIETAVPGIVNMVRLDFLSNHGSSSHTCIYRFRVHGYDPGSLMAMAG